MNRTLGLLGGAIVEGFATPCRITTTGGTLGSKPNGRTRRRVELFTFPEQLPGPARFGKGCMMQSVVATAVEYVKSPNKALEDIRDALARFAQAYDATLVEQGWIRGHKDEEAWDYAQDTHYETWQFSQNSPLDLTDMRVCERLIFVFKCVALARKREPELFGILIAAPEQGELDLVSWISVFMQRANGEATFRLGSYPLLEFEQKLEAFEFEILTSDRFINPGESNSAILKESDPEAKAFRDGKKWCTADYAAERFRIQAPQLTKAATNAKGLYDVPVERKRAQIGIGKEGIQFVYHAGSLQLLRDAIGRAKKGEE